MDAGVRDESHADNLSVSSEGNCPVCELCGSFEGLKICAACKDAWYCCKDHQRTHWSLHKTVCRSTKSKCGQAKEGSTTPVGNSTEETSVNTRVAHPNGEVSTPSSDQESRVDLNQCTIRADESEQKVFKQSQPSGNSSTDTAVCGGVEGVSDHNNSATTSEHISGTSKTEGDSTEKQKGAKSTGHTDKTSTSSSGASCARKGTEMTLNNDVSDSPDASGDSSPQQHPEAQTVKAKAKSAKRKLKSGGANMAQSTPNTQTMPEPDSATRSLADYVVKCLTQYGICVVDEFLGQAKGNSIYEEVLGLHTRGIFEDGQLISAQGRQQAIRGDQITWVERGETGKDQTSFLMGRLDNLMMACNEKFHRHELGGRTKAMVACYPGNGAYYLRHVDNPNEDGRLITCIYYLNKDWDVKRDGGMLRIFPENVRSKWVADIEPKFDRLLFFWSDRRNPHEVQAAYKQRFAITVWYFDKTERQQALSRYQNTDMRPGNARTMSTTLVSSGTIPE